jgi:hypothetical protein
VLEAFAEGRLEVVEHTLLEPHVWLTAAGDARIRSGTFLNIGVRSPRSVCSGNETTTPRPPNPGGAVDE